MPFLDRGGYFARAFPSRSYVIAARVRGAIPEAMLINAAPPIRSIRAVPFHGEELLMVLGEDHHTGSSVLQTLTLHRAVLLLVSWQVIL